MVMGGSSCCWLSFWPSASAAAQQQLPAVHSMHAMLLCASSSGSVHSLLVLRTS
eukprot:COSAG01_NODE_1219_length_11174_cov_9.438555_12_plen_54_part_00